MKNSTVLITGANGFLGQKLSFFLSQNKFNVIATGLGPDQSQINHDHQYFNLDITSSKDCVQLLDQVRPDLIINSAAITNVDFCEKNQRKCFAVNSKSIKNFIPYVQKHNIHFIQISTDFVFEGLNSFYTEDDICVPINIYGESKLEAESLIKKSNILYTILRPSLLYGIGRGNFLTWSLEHLKDNADLKIVDDQHRTPTFILDLVLVIFQVIKLKKYGTYHISSGECLSIFEIVCNIAKYLNIDYSRIRKIKSIELNQIADRPINSSLCIDKAIRDLNFEPTKLNNALSKIL
ncbi:MAG: NAD(P)-dependent oxidoreductase [Flavobacteriales bacterium]|nr:NAD(P)-dependent oxidoreductase [Flavobacteriales bacterium]